MVRKVKVTAVAALESHRPKRRLNKRRVRRAALLLSFLLLAALGSYFFLRSGLFAVRDIVVTGSAQVGADALRASSGIEVGQNIWDVGLSEVKSRIGRNPWVKSVSVRRQLPNVISIQVQERTPVALVVYRTAYVEVDEAGVALEISESLINRDLPLITGPLVTRVVLGQPVDAAGVLDGIRAVLPLSRELLRQVSEVHVGEDRDLTIIMLSKVRVYLGQPDATLEKRAGLLEGILDDVAQRGAVIDYIDLRYNGNPVSGTGDPLLGTK